MVGLLTNYKTKYYLFRYELNLCKNSYQKWEETKYLCKNILFDEKSNITKYKHLVFKNKQPHQVNMKGTNKQLQSISSEDN